MKVSIITVCFNAEATLERCIQNVAEQTYNNIEHIIIDGASTDGSPAILERYRERLAHCISEPDNGIYHAMNKGLRLATGDALYFLNADDQFTHDHVIAQVVEIFQQTDVDVLCGGIRIIDPKANTARVKQYPSVTRKQLLYGAIAQQALVYRSTAFQKCGDFAEDYRLAGDYEWEMRAVQRGLTFLPIELILCDFEVGGISTSPTWTSIQITERRRARAQYYSRLEFLMFRTRMVLSKPGVYLQLMLHWARAYLSRR